MRRIQFQRIKSRIWLCSFGRVHFLNPFRKRHHLRSLDWSPLHLFSICFYFLPSIHISFSFIHSLIHIFPTLWTFSSICHTMHHMHVPLFIHLYLYSLITNITVHRSLTFVAELWVIGHMPHLNVLPVQSGGTFFDYPVNISQVLWLSGKHKSGDFLTVHQATHGAWGYFPRGIHQLLHMLPCASIH